MGQAKKRGTFEERQALAISKNSQIETAYEEVMADIRKKEKEMWDTADKKLKDAQDDINYFLLTQAESMVKDEKRFVTDPDKDLIREDIAVIKVDENKVLVVHSNDYNHPNGKHYYVRNEEGVYVEENPARSIRRPFVPTREQLTYLIGANLADKAKAKLQPDNQIPEALETLSITEEEIISNVEAAFDSADTGTINPAEDTGLKDYVDNAVNAANRIIDEIESEQANNPAIEYVDDNPCPITGRGHNPTFRHLDDGPYVGTSPDHSNVEQSVSEVLEA